ncbi:MAG TPA: YbaB/EbfC family nucleoid-associated protein [Candidatus Acidoferrales bacterium]|nr:YbaB/EbfC family nucleoid-associated protein [Candidatus Acidoferrales bacterium]
MNQAQILAQVRKMQADMAKAQDEIAATVVTGTAAGGTVTVEMTADHALKSIKIAKEAVDPDDVEMLEDLIVVAVNDASAKAQEFASRKMGALTGGMKIPGLT